MIVTGRLTILRLKNYKSKQHTHIHTDPNTVEALHFLCTHSDVDVIMKHTSKHLNKRQAQIFSAMKDNSRCTSEVVDSA